MLALSMCLLVLVVAGAVVLRDGLREGTDKRATVPARTRRARPPRRRSRARSVLVLAASTLAIGVLTGAVLGLVGMAMALALRSVGGDS